MHAVVAKLKRAIAARSARRPAFARPLGRACIRGLMSALGVALAALVASVTTASSIATAQEQRGEVLVVLANERPGTIDDAVAQEPALRQPPFDAYRSMQLLERQPIVIQQGAPASVALPNGRTVLVELLGVQPGGRVRIRVAITRPNRSDYLPGVVVETAPGVPFFVAGQAFQGGMLVVGVRIGQRPPAPTVDLAKRKRGGGSR
jgi:hypothetical protein